jgi:hypothetical protein
VLKHYAFIHIHIVGGSSNNGSDPVDISVVCTTTGSEPLLEPPTISGLH